MMKKKEKIDSPYQLSVYLNSINYTKKDLMTEEDPLWEKKYPAFVINRCLSYHKDLITLVNEMNMRHQLSNKIQFHFLLNSIRKMKRFGSKWVSTNRTKAFDAIKKYYGYSNNKARVALDILTKEEQETIINKVSLGGKNE
jgi:hypothetical protein